MGVEAPDCEFGGREFESLLARQLNQKLRMVLPMIPGHLLELGYTTRYTTALACAREAAGDC